MAPIAEPYAQILKNVLKPGQDFGPVMFSSSTTGSTVGDAETIADPGYWIKNMLQPVEFEAAFLNMCFDSSGEQPAPRVDAILEVGAHGALGKPQESFR
jgi:acyl transferase domain-containing protein